MRAIQEIYGNGRSSRFVRAGGLQNMPNTLQMVLAEEGTGRTIVVVDGNDASETVIFKLFAVGLNTAVVWLPGTVDDLLGLSQINLTPTFELVAKDIREDVRNLPIHEAAERSVELRELFWLLGVPSIKK